MSEISDTISGRQVQETPTESDDAALGLALSGGGIRSATFNLGVLQGLARYGLLSQIDLLSTVSGGGYIGAWLLGLLHQKKPLGAQAAILEVEKQLHPDNSGDPLSPDSAPVRFLRQFSNYLTPETGLLSRDTWAMASIWLRNTLLNQMILVPLVGLILLLPRVAASLASVWYDKPWHITVWAPVIAVLLFSLVITLIVGLFSAFFDDMQLEALGQVGALCNMASTVWFVVAALSIYGPFIILKLGSALGVWIHTLTLGWIASTAGGLLSAKDPASGGNGRSSPGPAYWLSVIAPYVFLIGLLFIVSEGVDYAFQSAGFQSIAHFPKIERAGLILRVFDLRFLGSSFTGFALTSFTFAGFTFTLIAILALIAAVFALTVDINDFSMHNLYKNRLVRCYLGASRPDRQPKRWSGMDPNDDFALSELKGFRPHPIINTTLNMVHGDELAWQERKGESFTFSTDFCGFERPVLSDAGYRRGNYRPTEQYAGNVRLGTAFVISGAAVNPSWGYHSSPATTFLMALFNVRLGQWLGNPIGTKWTKRGPKTFLYWLYELLGYTNDKRDFVDLTDGGHFENLGIYELVRRECPLIIASDAGEDRDFTFEDLGGAIRKCRADFGADIDIQTLMLRPDAKTGWSECHCAVGVIKYMSGRTGYLLYLKASLTGDEPEDVLEYHREHREFPHQSTADQWFSESQFESYRRLGLHVVDTALETSIKNIGKSISPVTIGSLFEDLYRAWYPPSPFIKKSFIKHTTAFDEIMERFRNDDSLGLLSDLYPEMKPVYKPVLDEHAANTFLLCNALIQLMENVFIDLHLDEPEQLKHPHNRGWLNLFKIWSKSDAFKDAWKVCGATFGERFQIFCRRELMLPNPSAKN
jgi:Patatin-like phospholipase